MWASVARTILRFRIGLLILVVAITAFMAYHAMQVQLSYEFARAIPTDHPKYKAYQDFRKTFGEDGSLLVIGLESNNLFDSSFFNSYSALSSALTKVPSVEAVLSVPAATNLVKDDSLEKLDAVPIFPPGVLSQQLLDSLKTVFFNLPFYRSLLYDANAQAYLIGININKNVLNSAARTRVVNNILRLANEFGQRQNVNLYYSGLPLIRTTMANRIAAEMRWFLLGSLLLSALILFVFFRSFATTFLSLAVVVIGVIWSFGTMHMLGFRITLLNALIPPLVVVIGIPNCIYFINKYHSSIRNQQSIDPANAKRSALTDMISKMGVVTLFCNIAAAIGFAVFALTKSAILKEFGIVAGINIMALFFISLVMIPAILSFLKPPSASETKYLENRWLLAILDKLERWSLHHKRLIFGVTAAIVVLAVVGIFRLKSEGFIVDDLPKTDKLYTDLKFFERNFKGIMPLEIIVDTRKKNGLRSNPLQTFGKIDSLSAFIGSMPELNRPLSVVEGLKFARQAYYDGDSTNYGLPNSFDIAFLSQYLSMRGGKSNNLSKLTSSFMDSSRQRARISVNMADVGSRRLEELLDTIQHKTSALFDTARYKVELTGSSVTFLEGSTFIINGLKESILWAFALIAASMLYLFRSVRILFCSLIPNIIPLIITAGIMGWTGVRIKPSTVLVFSVALGIAIDITIRFLVNYKQEIKATGVENERTVIDTIHKTGISIIYTSVVLIAGFIIFCFSGFGGTQALGWLTSLTLVMATLTNLVFLPALLLATGKRVSKTPAS
jgi:predicted RND superfamily exporter protein